MPHGSIEIEPQSRGHHYFWMWSVMSLCSFNVEKIDIAVAQITKMICVKPSLGPRPRKASICLQAASGLRREDWGNETGRKLWKVFFWETQLSIDYQELLKTGLIIQRLSVSNRSHCEHSHYWHRPHGMQSRVNETMRCLSICMSHSFAAAGLLLWAWQVGDINWLLHGRHHSSTEP